MLPARRERRSTGLIYRRISEALDVPTRTSIDSLFDKPEGSRQTACERVKTEPGQSTIKGVRRFLENARWLKEQTIDSSAVSRIPAVKLQRFAAEGRALNAAILLSMPESAKDCINFLDFDVAPTVFDDQRVPSTLAWTAVSYG